MQNVFPVITAMRSYSTSWEQDKPPFCMFSFLCVSISTLHSRALYCVSSVHSKLDTAVPQRHGRCVCGGGVNCTLQKHTRNIIPQLNCCHRRRRQRPPSYPYGRAGKCETEDETAKCIARTYWTVWVWVLDKNEWRKTKKENIVCECGRCGGFARM